MKPTAWLRGLLVLTVSGCTSTETADQTAARIERESAAAKTAIEAIWARAIGALNAGDVEPYTSAYLENGRRMPPNGPSQNGQAAIREGLKKGLDGSQVTLTIESVVANGPLAVELSKYAVAADPKHTPPIAPDTGKFLVHWHLVNGQWRIAALLLNSNRP